MLLVWFFCLPQSWFSTLEINEFCKVGFASLLDYMMHNVLIPFMLSFGFWNEVVYFLLIGIWLSSFICYPWLSFLFAHVYMFKVYSLVNCIVCLGWEDTCKTCSRTKWCRGCVYRGGDSWRGRESSSSNWHAQVNILVPLFINLAFV